MVTSDWIHLKTSQSVIHIYIFMSHSHFFHLKIHNLRENLLLSFPMSRQTPFLPTRGQIIQQNIQRANRFAPVLLMSHHKSHCNSRRIGSKRTYHIILALVLTRRHTCIYRVLIMRITSLIIHKTESFWNLNSLKRQATKHVEQSQNVCMLNLQSEYH